MGGWATFVVAFAAIGLVTLLVMEITLTMGCLFNLRSGIQALVLVAVGLSMPDLSLSRSAAKKSAHADASVSLASSASAASIFVGLGLPWTIATLYHWMKYDQAFYVGKFETADMAFSLAVLGVCTLISLAILALRRRISGGEIGGAARFFSGTILILLWVVFIASSNLNSYGYLGQRDIFVPEAQIKAN
jgi:solute carrier family 8 (sodium/calcium exchanger)